MFYDATGSIVIKLNSITGAKIIANTIPKNIPQIITSINITKIILTLLITFVHNEFVMTLSVKIICM